MEPTQDVFGHLTLAPPDPILGTALAYKADTDPKKMNLGIGAYRTDEEHPYVFEVVRKAEQEIAQDSKLDKEYLPIDGLAAFTVCARNLLFGETNPLVKEGRIVTTQTLSGTGALRVGFEFLKNHAPGDVYVSKPTWGNHNTIIQLCGLKCIEHPYWDESKRGLDYDGMINTFKAAKPGSIVLLHACAHNPTGVDPTEEQWKGICQVMKEGKLFPFFDSAYQGYASGDLDKDAWAINYFLSQGMQMIVSQSFAKNFGLYGERIGALHFVCGSKDIADKVLSQVKLVIRPMYSNPPLHGARLVARVLGNKEYNDGWRAELKAISGRIQSVRTQLRDELVRIGCKGNWDHIVNQIGMFSYTGLTTPQCEIMISKFHIYMLKNGRISMAGINSKNVAYLASSIKQSIDETS